MKIEHVAIWVQNLEHMKSFYEKFFDGAANSLYHNAKTNFSSYFIQFEEGPRLELMHMTSIPGRPNNSQIQTEGIIHMAFSVGSKEKVISLTEELRTYGCTVASEPRMTGDGYFESCILDPEGNRIEIIA